MARGGGLEGSMTADGHVAKWEGLPSTTIAACARHTRIHATALTDITRHGSCKRSEAKEKNREGWYMAYIMDTNEEERVKVWHMGAACV